MTTRGKTFVSLPAKFASLRVVAAVVLLLFLAAGAAASDDQAKIKAKLQSEKDPIKRAQLEVRLAEFRLDEAQQNYDGGTPEKGLEQLREMVQLLADAHDRMFDTGRNPRKKPKGFKEAEIKFREIVRRLKDLRLSIPLDEREPLDTMVVQISKMQEHLLDGLMQVKEAQK